MSTNIDNNLSLNDFFVINDFLTNEEEAMLLKLINENKWLDNRDKTRRVQISGPFHDSSYKMIPNKFSDHPEFIKELAHKISTYLSTYHTELFNRTSSKDKWINNPNQNLEVYINEFLKYQGLAPHFDHRKGYEELIIGISLNSDSHITFTKGKSIAKVPLKKCSMYAMYGDSRNIWKHSIDAKDVLDKRISITFRTIS